MSLIGNDFFIPKVEEFFSANVFDESRVIGIEFDVSKCLFELTLNHTYSPAYIEYKKSQNSLPDEFVCLLFGEVRNFKAKDRFIRNESGQIQYNLQNSGSLEIESIELKEDKLFNITINFAWDTKCEFDFQILQVKRRTGISKKRESENEYHYFDAETGEPFDFYYPFNRM